MIFVTVGTQLAFPRLLDAMEAIAPDLDEQVIAQTGPDSTRRRGIESHDHMAPAEFGAHLGRARIVVSHAGIGTILAAKQNRKPLVLFPRRHALGEHRNDHQLATARQLAGQDGIHVAWKAEELAPLITRTGLTAAGPELGPEAERLIGRLRQFIDM